MYFYPNIRRSKGEVFIILFWIIIVLGAIIFGLSARASYETKMVSATWKKSQAYFVSWTGIRKIMQILNQDDPTVDSWWDKWSVGVKKGKTKEGEWRVGIIYDEERFIDIAGYTKYPVPNSVLKRIFYYYNKPPVKGPTLYYSLLDWRDADHIPRTDPATGKIMGAEDNFYLPFRYEARDGPLKNLFELGMIKGGFGIFNKQVNPTLKKFSSNENKLNNINYILSILGARASTVYAHCGSTGHHQNPGDPPPPVFPPPLPPPPPPHPPPEPPEEWPPFEPGPPAAPVGPGRSVTVYGDGRLNINTAYPGALLAMGLNLEAVKRIYWYKMQGNVFPKGDAQTIIKELIRTGWLFPTEVKYKMITDNIKKIAPRLKVNSSYFFVYLISHVSKARHFVMAVIKRFPGKGGISRCKIVSWVEWTLTPTS